LAFFSAASTSARFSLRRTIFAAIDPTRGKGFIAG
jgi:hypothetical protein